MKNGTILLYYIGYGKFLNQHILVNFVLIKLCSSFLSTSQHFSNLVKFELTNQ